MIEKTTENINKLFIKTTEHEEALKRLDKIDTRLSKVEYLMWWCLGGVSAIGGASVIKFIFDVAYNMHK